MLLALQPLQCGAHGVRLVRPPRARRRTLRVPLGQLPEERRRRRRLRLRLPLLLPRMHAGGLARRPGCALALRLLLSGQGLRRRALGAHLVLAAHDAARGLHRCIHPPHLFPSLLHQLLGARQDGGALLLGRGVGRQGGGGTLLALRGRGALLRGGQLPP